MSILSFPIDDGIILANAFGTLCEERLEMNVKNFRDFCKGTGPFVELIQATAPNQFPLMWSQCFVTGKEEHSGILPLLNIVPFKYKPINFYNNEDFYEDEQWLGFNHCLKIKGARFYGTWEDCGLQLRNLSVRGESKGLY